MEEGRRMGTSDRGRVRKRINNLVWLESKCCEAVKKKKNSHTSDLLLYNKLAQNLVAKPTVFIIFYGFRGSGIQEHLG